MSSLVLLGTDNFLFSVTQDDPLSMLLYAVEMLSLIYQMKQWVKMWYTDDASACGAFSNFLDWLKVFSAS